MLKPAREFNSFYPLLLHRDGLVEHFFDGSDYSPISTADAFDFMRPVRRIDAQSAQCGSNILDTSASGNGAAAISKTLARTYDASGFLTSLTSRGSTGTPRTCLQCPVDVQNLKVDVQNLRWMSRTCPEPEVDVQNPESDASRT